MAIALIDKYTDYNGAGKNLHIVLDDGNYDNSSLYCCMDFSKKDNDLFGETIINLLKEFTVEERKQIIENYWEIDDLKNE